MELWDLIGFTVKYGRSGFDFSNSREFVKTFSTASRIGKRDAI